MTMVCGCHGCIYEMLICGCGYLALTPPTQADTLGARKTISEAHTQKEMEAIHKVNIDN